MDLDLTADRFRAVFDMTPLGIAIADRHGGLLEANPAFLAMFGFSLQEAQGRNFIDLVHPEGRNTIADLAQGVRDGKADSYQAERRCIRKDGREFWAVVRCKALRDGKGDITHWLGIMEDISARQAAEKERQRLAAQVQQAQKMEAIGTLAGGIAHDFNNLLMGIQGNISLLLLDKPPDHRDVTYLKNIEKSVMRASELTRQILGFARGGKYEVKVTDINALLEKTAEMFGRTRKEITIRQNFQKAPWKIEADQSQLQQVLLNLLVNAWQAMPGGGELMLQTANVVIDAGYPDKPLDAVPGPYVRIDVTDTGVGMDTHTQARIFEPFFTTREKSQGTGLGLSSAFGIVKNHNGFITVRSEKGRGSTFSVFFPATSGAATEKPKPAGVARSGGNTILLVEDEEMVATIGRQMLERLGYRVIVAQTGDEALSLYEKLRAEIDLVILDMIMPGMGGGAVFDRIRAIDPQAAVLLSSGYSLNGQALKIMNRGCRGFIQKPFSIEQLKQKIREILSSGQDQTG
jgi:PAS domain S-box-containing protein